MLGSDFRNKKQENTIVVKPTVEEKQSITPSEVGAVESVLAQGQTGTGLPTAAEGTVHQPAGQSELATIDLAADAQEFQDEYDHSAIQIPFFQILQSNSPQLLPGDPKYIDAAKQGQFVNTVTRELFGKVEVIPVYHRSTIIEWRLRESGGGFVADLGLVDGERALRTTQKNEKGQDILANGNQLVRTEVYFLLIVTPNGTQQVMCTMTSTQLKKARNWNSRLLSTKIELPNGDKVKAPMFFNSFILTTATEKNEKGSWWGFVISDGRPTLAIGKDVYLEARAYRQVVSAGVQAGNINMDETVASDVNKEPIPF